MKIINPLSPNNIEEDIKTVLYALAGQGGCDGEPYDQMQVAADYIAELEAQVEKLKAGNRKSANDICDSDFGRITGTQRR